MSHESNAPRKLDPLTPAVFHILLALATTDRHGYGIMKQAEMDSAGHVKLGPGTLYGTIKRLLDAGLIAEVGEHIDRDLDDERRRYYQITKLGQTALGLEVARLGQAVSRAQELGISPLRQLRSRGVMS